jgi:8-oxo-dGTP diphosphatase
MLVRVTSSAAIVRDNKILLVRFKDQSAEHFNLPGGGVKEGESAIEAARREAMEETVSHVKVGELLLAWEYVPQKSHNKYGVQHKIGLIFECKLLPGSEPKMPSCPDDFQVGVDWVHIDQLTSLRLPRRSPLLPNIAEKLKDALETKKRVPFHSE